MKKAFPILFALLAVAACRPGDGQRIANTARAVMPTPTPISGQAAAAPVPPHGDKPGRIDLRALPGAARAKASRGGTYLNALAAIYEPAAKDPVDGEREALSEYLGTGPLPGGWWVYESPYWVVWQTKAGE